jgi:hypothetical protein
MTSVSRLIAVGLTAAALAFVAGSATAATVVKNSSGPLVATLTPGSHTPKINAKWPLTVTATLSSRPVRASAAFVRVIAANPIDRLREEPREEWLIIEWPEGHEQPSDYWLSNLPADTEPEQLARLARLRWMIELDYKQLKGELGLDHAAHLEVSDRPLLHLPATDQPQRPPATPTTQTRVTPPTRALLGGRADSRSTSRESRV